MDRWMVWTILGQNDSKFHQESSNIIKKKERKKERQQNNLSVNRVEKKKGTDTRDKEDGITCLALISAVTVWTVTRVTVDLVFTGPSVLTGTAVTLVDICRDKTHTSSLEVGNQLT